MKKLTLFSLFALLITFSSCKRTETEEPVKTTAQKIQVKWNIQSIVQNDVTSTGVHSDNYNGKAGDYVHFKADGKLESKLTGQPLEQLSYTIDSDKQVTIDGDIHQIKDLTDKSLTLYHKTNYTDGYYEITIVLGK